VRFGFASSAFTKPTALHHECIWLRLRRAVSFCEICGLQLTRLLTRQIIDTKPS